MDADAVIPNLTTVIVSGDASETESASPDEFYEVEEIFSNVIDAEGGKGEYGSPMVQDSTVDDGSHKDIWKEYSDPHTFQGSTSDDGIQQQVGRMGSGINAVKDITVDDVNYKLEGTEDSDPHAVKDIAVDEGEVKSTSAAVTFDGMKTLETKEVNVDVHDELAIMQNNHGEGINATDKELESKAGQQEHDLSRQHSDKLHPSTEKNHHFSNSKPIGDTVAAKHKIKQQEPHGFEAKHAIKEDEPHGFEAKHAIHQHEPHGFEAKHAKPNATTRWILIKIQCMYHIHIQGQLIHHLLCRMLSLLRRK